MARKRRFLIVVVAAGALLSLGAAPLAGQAGIQGSGKSGIAGIQGTGKSGIAGIEGSGAPR